MNNSNVVRAWRDYEFQEGLSDDIKNELPANPAGAAKFVMVTAADLESKSTFISDTCDTFISGCCSTFISNTCSTFISDCCN